MFNKNMFKKLNDKKLLHKIGKRWVTISIGILALLGFGALSTTASANTTTAPTAVVGKAHLTPAQRAANRLARRSSGGNNPLNNKINTNKHERATNTTPADLYHKAQTKSATDQTNRANAQAKSVADQMNRENAQAQSADDAAAKNAANGTLPAGNPLPAPTSEDTDGAASASSEQSSLDSSIASASSASASAASSKAAKDAAEESAGASADDAVNNGIQNAIKSGEAKGETAENAVKGINSNTVNSLAKSAGSAEKSALSGSSSTNPSSSSNSSSANNPDIPVNPEPINPVQPSSSSASSNQPSNNVIPSIPFIPTPVTPNVTPANVSASSASQALATPAGDNNGLVIFTNANTSQQTKKNARKSVKLSTVKDVNSIKRGHVGYFHGLRVTHIYGKALRYFYGRHAPLNAKKVENIRGTRWLYSNILDNKKSHVANLRRGMKVNIKRIFAVKFGKSKSYIRIEISVKRGRHVKNLFMTGNSKCIRLFK